MIHLNRLLILHESVNYLLHLPFRPKLSRTNNILLHLPYIGIFCCTYLSVKCFVALTLFSCCTYHFRFQLCSFYPDGGWRMADGRHRSAIGATTSYPQPSTTTTPCHVDVTGSRNHGRRARGVIYRKRYASHRVGWSLRQISMLGAMG